MDIANVVRIDAKHWLGKKRPDEELQIDSYEHVAQQAARNLGRNGIVAIPNARADENRFEEFIGRAPYGIESIEGGKVFYDPVNEIYFMKAQEVNTKINEVPITFLVYNLPFNKNLNDKHGLQVLTDAYELDCILGLTLAKKGGVHNLERALQEYPHLLSHLDFVFGYSGIEALRNSNESALELYRENIREALFVHPYSKKEHFIGILAGSGGHRTPKTFLGKLSSGFRQTIGSSGSDIYEPSPDSFMPDFRESVQNAQEVSMHMQPIWIEALRHKFSLSVSDPLHFPHFK